MKKRLLALLLALTSLLALALPAQAAVLSGNTSKVDYDNTDPARYWIEIDLKNQIISVYESMTGALVLQSLCTTGSDETPTGAGVYKLGDLKERFGYFVAFGQYAQYWTQVVRGVYIHSVMYDSKDLDSMSKSAYRNLGKNLSHGCVRVLPHIAQWIYYNCPPGTTCRITNEKARDEALCKALKAAIPDYDDYEQPKDERPAPPEVPAVVRYNKTPLRTGFSASKDETVEILPAGAQVLLLQIGAEWCKVRCADGELGYIKTAYLHFDPDAPIETVESFAATKETYIYASRSTGSDKLTAIPKGAQVQVSAEAGESWYEASYGGVSGYARKKYVKPSVGYVYPSLPMVQTAPVLAAGSTGEAAQSTNSATSTHTRADSAVNMRARPATSAALVATLPPNSMIYVMSIEGSWYYCSAGSLVGYLHESCLQ